MGDDTFPEDEPLPWAPDDPTTTSQPIEQQRPMTLHEPQTWAAEPAYPQPSQPEPWAQTQYAYPAPTPQPTSGSSGRTLWIVAAAAVAVIVIAAVAIIVLRPASEDHSAAADGRPGHPGSRSSGQSVTKCGSPPSASVVDARDANGGLVLKLRITASCSGGDVLSSSSTRIAVGSRNGVNVASGVFDLSARPIYVPAPDDQPTGGTVDQEFWFGTDSYWLPITTMGSQYSASSAAYQVDFAESGTSSTTSGTPGSSSASMLSATGPGQPMTGDAETAAGSALRAIADADEPIITRDLADRWIPQLSSKWLGLVWEGTNWDNSAILREHLRLRTRFPNVRLMWSPDWSSFQGRAMWVTAAGITFPTSHDALGWCISNGFDRDHCYAKLVSKTHPPEGSTELLPG